MASRDATIAPGTPSGAPIADFLGLLVLGFFGLLVVGLLGLLILGFLGQLVFGLLVFGFPGQLVFGFLDPFVLVIPAGRTNSASCSHIPQLLVPRRVFADVVAG
jgi:hypothetical protein